MVGEYYKAARNGAAVVAEDWLGAITLVGAERSSWLQGMVSNDVEKLTPGEGCHAAHLNAQGRVIAQMTALADDNNFWLVMERSAVGRLLSAFDKLIVMEDVLAQDASEEFEVLGVIGPRAKSVLESWLGEPLNLDGLYRHRKFRDCHVVWGDLGYDILIRREFSDRALRAMAEHGAAAIDHGTWDVLRTEAGLPVYGVDIDDSTTLPELGERGISYDKGCYIGQEVVARIKYIGHVNRRFAGFTVESDDLPETRSIVERDGKNVGYVTTSLLSPGLGKPIALGFVNRSASEPGTKVQLVGAGTNVSAVVASLPFIPARPEV